MAEKQKKGFALAENRKNINRGGRPPNSRNKNKLGVAQRRIDDATPDAAAYYHAILTGNREVLQQRFGFTDAQIDAISPTLRMNAAKEIIKGGSEEMKAITGEQGKKSDDDEDEEESTLKVVPFTFKRDEIEQTEDFDYE